MVLGRGPPVGAGVRTSSPGSSVAYVQPTSRTPTLTRPTTRSTRLRTGPLDHGLTLWSIPAPGQSDLDPPPWLWTATRGGLRQRQALG